MSKKRIRNDEEISQEKPARKLAKIANQKRTIFRLFDEGNTIPFLARYRKELIGDLTPDDLRHLHEEYEGAKEFDAKASKLIEKGKKLGPEVSAEIEKGLKQASNLEDIEALAAQFKTSTSKSLANQARGMPDNLEQVAEKCLKTNYKALKKDYNDEQIKNVGYIISDILLHKPEVADFINGLSQDRKICLLSKVNSKKKNEKSAFKHYFDFKGFVHGLKSHQVLAINRGEKKKELKVNIELPDEIFERNLIDFCLRNCLDGTSSIIKESLSEAYKRLVKPSIKRKIRSRLTRKAETEALNVFADNLRQLLLTPPCRNSVVMALDPGFKHGCKIAVIDAQGQVLKTGVVHPHFQDLNVKDEKFMLETIKKYEVDIIGIGNKTGFAQAEMIIANMIRKYDLKKVAFTSVNEDGASIYSVSKEASNEFPDLDPNLISAVSIARRLQDPLAEYVKIGPSHLGVGMYQHDLSESRLSKTLDLIVSECVSFVGVDLNQAPHYLLSHVSGISAKTATKIIEWRTKNGPFTCRQDLLKVKGIGEKSFQQAAGFVRVINSSNPLDATLIHPESYSTADQVLQLIDFDAQDIGSEKLMKKLLQNKENLLAKMKGQANIDQVLDALVMDIFKDFRDTLSKSIILKTQVLSLDNLKIGQCIEGSVKNVTHFGAFVDIGVGKDALLHQTKFKGKTAPKLGDRLEVIIKSIDVSSGRIALDMK